MVTEAELMVELTGQIAIANEELRDLVGNKQALDDLNVPGYVKIVLGARGILTMIEDGVNGDFAEMLRAHPKETTGVLDVMRSFLEVMIDLFNAIDQTRFPTEGHIYHLHELYGKMQLLKPAAVSS